MSETFLTREAPAKLNLFFELHGRRADGYHEVETVTLPIDLTDTLEFERTHEAETPLTLSVSDERGEGSGGPIPTDDRNLIIRAARTLTERTGVCYPTRIHLTKRIPSEAGLGGGSSDAAATLKALNQLWATDLSDAQLRRLGAGIGSDVPLFFESGAALGHGRGELVEPVPCNAALSFALFKPPFGLSTAEVYRACRVVPESERRTPDTLLSAMAAGDLPAIGAALFNRLEEAAFQLRPELAEYLAQMSGEDVFAARMTGSGTALYALNRSQNAVAGHNFPISLPCR